MEIHSESVAHISTSLVAQSEWLWNIMNSYENKVNFKSHTEKHWSTCQGKSLVWLLEQESWLMSGLVISDK